CGLPPCSAYLSKIPQMCQVQPLNGHWIDAFTSPSAVIVCFTSFWRISSSMSAENGMGTRSVIQRRQYSTRAAGVSGKRLMLDQTVGRERMAFGSAPLIGGRSMSEYKPAGPWDKHYRLRLPKVMRKLGRIGTLDQITKEFDQIVEGASRRTISMYCDACSVNLTDRRGLFLGRKDYDPKFHFLIKIARAVYAMPDPKILNLRAIYYIFNRE